MSVELPHDETESWNRGSLATYRDVPKIHVILNI